MKTILITGATDGIGFQTALEIARRGHHVLVHGRHFARTEQAARKILLQNTNARVEPVSADFASLTQVRQLAHDVSTKHDRLDVLINNAGVYMARRVLTEDGFETTLQVNHLVHFMLTNLLLDLIKQSAPSRIINVSSGAHTSGRIEFDNLQGERGYDGYRAYAASKLANLLFTYELTERLRGTRVTANCLHPGVIETKLLRAGFNGGGAKPERGAETPVYLALAPEVENVTGKYFVNTRAADSSPASRDKKLRTHFWQVSEELVGAETPPILSPWQGSGRGGR